jgi:MFS family permease
MTTETTDLADRLTLRRARIATPMAIVFAISQAGSFPADNATLNRPQIFHLVAWGVWAVALFVFLIGGFGMFRGPDVRALLNDETTLDNRRRALALGFWGAIVTAIGMYALTFVDTVSARDATRIIITVAIVMALLRFSVLEKRALKDG